MMARDRIKHFFMVLRRAYGQASSETSLLDDCLGKRNNRCGGVQKVIGSGGNAKADGIYDVVYRNNPNRRQTPLSRTRSRRRAASVKMAVSRLGAPIQMIRPPLA